MVEDTGYKFRNDGALDKQLEMARTQHAILQGQKDGSTILSKTEQSRQADLKMEI